MMENTQKFSLSEIKKGMEAKVEHTDSFATQILVKNSDKEMTEEELELMSEIANERYFLMKGRVDLAFATRHRTDIALLMLQVDKFEMLKHEYKPVIIQGVLTKLGKYIKSELRLEDTVARLSDELYGVLLMSSDPLGALEVAERIRQKIKRKTIVYKDTRLSITVSAGVSAPPVTEQRSFNKMLHEARAELSKAVAAGGDSLMAEAVRKRVITEDSIGKKVISLDDALSKIRNNQEKQLDDVVSDLFSQMLPVLRYCDSKLSLGIAQILDGSSKPH